MTDKLTIRESDPRDPRIVAILEAHLELMRSQSPPESVHALDVDGLCVPSVTFLAAWYEDVPLGCGALKLLDAGHGEIKSMHTIAAARGQGVARGLLKAIEELAVRKKLHRLSLETGSQIEFEPARLLYRKFDYEVCSPFADYKADPASTFMTKSIISK